MRWVGLPLHGPEGVAEDEEGFVVGVVQGFEGVHQAGGELKKVFDGCFLGSEIPSRELYGNHLYGKVGGWVGG